MQRPIEFRGKTNDGKFLHGDLAQIDGECFIFPRDGSTDSPDRYQVDPTTVGQFTGLTDKNGAKIFEGSKVCYVNYNGTLSLPYEVYYRKDVAAFWIYNSEQKNYQPLASQLPLIIDPETCKTENK